MPPWLSPTIDILQLIVNLGALVGGAIIWNLYVGNLKAALTAKDAEISSAEKHRDIWRDKAEELEKRSPEVMERILSERIQTRDTEITRLAEDKSRHAEVLTRLQREKAYLESDLSRTRGFRLMLALEEGDISDTQMSDEFESSDAQIAQADDIQVVRLGDVAVDSGQLMITDPCYVDAEWESARYNNHFSDGEPLSEQPGSRLVDVQVGGDARKISRYSYEGACETSLSTGYGELTFSRGHIGAAVVFGTAWGDGIYPVYGEMHDGRIIRVYINLG